MTRTKRRFALPEFETCSLALFAALAFGVVTPQAHAQVFGPAGAQPSKVAPTVKAATMIKSGNVSVAATPAIGQATSKSVVKARATPMSAVSTGIHSQSGLAAGAAPENAKPPR